MSVPPSAAAVAFVDDVRRMTSFYQSPAAMAVRHADDQRRRQRVRRELQFGNLERGWQAR